MNYSVQFVEQVQYETARMHKAMMAFGEQIGEQIEYDLRCTDPFSRFPKGCCSLASQILAKHLVQMVKMKPVYIDVSVPDEMQPTKSCLAHAWLHYGKFVLDITAGQFFSDRPYMFYVFEDSEFYAELKANGMRAFDYGESAVPFDTSPDDAEVLKFNRFFNILTGLLPGEEFNWREYLSSLAGK